MHSTDVAHLLLQMEWHGLFVFVMIMSPAKAAEMIQIPLSQTPVCPRNYVLDGCLHWCHFVNSVDQCAAVVMQRSVFITVATSFH